MQIEAAKGRANKFVDSILRLSNVEAIGKYVLGSAQSTSVSSGFNSKVIGFAVTDAQVMLQLYGEASILIGFCVGSLKLLVSCAAFLIASISLNRNLWRSTRIG